MRKLRGPEIKKKGRSGNVDKRGEGNREEGADMGESFRQGKVRWVGGIMGAGAT